MATTYHVATWTDQPRPMPFNYLAQIWRPPRSFPTVTHTLQTSASQSHDINLNEVTPDMLRALPLEAQLATLVNEATQGEFTTPVARMVEQLRVNGAVLLLNLYAHSVLDAAGKPIADDARYAATLGDAAARSRVTYTGTLDTAAEAAMLANLPASITNMFRRTLTPLCQGSAAVLSPACAAVCEGTAYLDNSVASLGGALVPTPSDVAVERVAAARAVATSFTDKAGRGLCALATSDNLMSVASVCNQCDAQAVRFCGLSSVGEGSDAVDPAVTARCSCIKSARSTTLNALAQTVAKEQAAGLDIGGLGILTTSGGGQLLPCLDGGACFAQGYITTTSLQQQSLCGDKSISCANVYTVLLDGVEGVDLDGLQQSCVLNIQVNAQGQVELHPSAETRFIIDPKKGDVAQVTPQGDVVGVGEQKQKLTIKFSPWLVGGLLVIVLLFVLFFRLFWHKS